MIDFKLAEKVYIEPGNEALFVKDSLYRIKYEDSKVSFDYSIEYFYGEKKYVVLYDVLSKTSILDIPDEIDGYPVLSVYILNNNKIAQIKKIVLGNNTVRISATRNCFNEINEIVIKKDTNCPPYYLSQIIHRIDATSIKNPNITILDNRYIFDGEFILSADKKELLTIVTRHSNIILPDSIEIVRQSAFRYGEKNELIIEWPENIKEIEDIIPQKNIDWKLLDYVKVPNTLEVLNNTVVRRFLTKNDVGTTLTITDSIKTILPSAFEHCSSINNVVVNDNPRYEYINYFLIDTYNKTLISYFGERNLTIVELPKEIENITEYSFKHALKIKEVVLENKNTNLIKQLKNIGIKAIIKNSSKNKKILDKDPIYVLNNNKIYISNNVDCEKLELDIDSYKHINNLTFVITKECANIKELIIPEGIANVTIDKRCYEEDFKLEILDIASSCKFIGVLGNLNMFNNLMLVIINPIIKPKFTVHRLDYIIGCKGNHSLKKDMYTVVHESCTGGGYINFIDINDYEAINEITYVKNFDRDKLVITDEAYYYLKNEKELSLLKVRTISKFTNPKIINGYKVTKEYDYCYSKYNKK